jgi:hypothetical protein
VQTLINVGIDGAEHVSLLAMSGEVIFVPPAYFIWRITDEIYKDT